MLAKKFGFGFGIAIILPIMIHYGVSTFSPQPKWNSYYQYNNYDDTDYSKLSDEEKKNKNIERKKKDEEYRFQQKTFQRRLFYVATPVGIAAIIIGSFLAVQAVGAGLIFGGIFTITDGYCWYWTELDDWMRFLSLLIAFSVLVVVGYIKMNDKSKGVPK